MSGPEIIFAFWLSLVAAALVLTLAGSLLSLAWRGRYGAKLDAYIAGCRADGESLGNAFDNLRLREEMARLRIVASDRVLADPANWIAILDQEKAASVRRLSMQRDLAKHFGNVVRDLPYTHILLPKAAQAAQAQIPAYVDREPEAYQVAALNVVRSS